MVMFDLEASWPDTQDPHRLSQFADEWNAQQKRRRRRHGAERLDGSPKAATLPPCSYVQGGRCPGCGLRHSCPNCGALARYGRDHAARCPRYDANHGPE